MHEIEADIYYGDSLAEGPHASKRYDVVMTNPPFGTKGAGEAPTRENFTVETSNKQLNFLQHVMTILKPGGHAAIVLPDNVLTDEAAGKEVRKLLMTDCNLHTILRLPVGTFTPYSSGVKANILFFTKGEPTEEVWIYDNRTRIEKVNIGHPLTPDYFSDFETCYHMRPRKVTDRFRRFTREEIAKQYSDDLDIVWLKDETTQNEQKLGDPEELVQEAAAQLQTASDALSEITLVLDNVKKMRSNA